MDREDHKTFIPGVGFLVTSWDGSESHIFPINEPEEVNVNIESLVTLDNAAKWDNADNQHQFLLGLLGANATIPEVLKLREALEQELMEASEAEHDGQPSHYEEMQDYMGGDDPFEYDDGGEW
jgi:hypothetical protein